MRDQCDGSPARTSAAGRPRARVASGTHGHGVSSKRHGDSRHDRRCVHTARRRSGTCSDNTLPRHRSRQPESHEACATDVCDQCGGVGCSGSTYQRSNPRSHIAHGHPTPATARRTQGRPCIGALAAWAHRDDTTNSVGAGPSQRGVDSTNGDAAGSHGSAVSNNRQHQGQHRDYERNPRHHQTPSTCNQATTATTSTMMPSTPTSWRRRRVCPHLSHIASVSP